MIAASRMQKSNVEEIRVSIRRQIEEWKRLIAESEAYLASLDKLPSSEDQQVFDLLAGLNLKDVSPPFKAIEMFLKKAGPQPRRVIVQALIVGGASLPAVDKEASVNTSITTNVGLGKLEEPFHKKGVRAQNQDNVVGLPGTIKTIKS